MSVHVLSSAPLERLMAAHMAMRSFWGMAMMRLASSGSMVTSE